VKKKMTDEERRSLLLQVSRLHYEQRMSKTEVSHVVRTSPTQVARLLQEAEDEGIIQFKFAPPEEERLGMDLGKRYPHLLKAIVIPSVPDPVFQRRLLGKKAAEYFEANVRPGMKVGISGGYTLFEMIENLPKKERSIEIYPTAVIGRGPTIMHIDPIILVTLLWAKSGGQPGTAYSVTVQAPQGSRSRKQIHADLNRLKLQEKARQVYEGMQSVDIVFASIGSMYADEEYRQATQHDVRQILGEMNLSEEELRREGAVGDISYSYFDENGNSRPEWSLFLSLDVGMLRKMALEVPSKQVVVVVGGYKTKALKAAVKGRLCNVLITDRTAARALLSEDQATS
jgi:deoxyribonucleoside regulator